MSRPRGLTKKSLKGGVPLSVPKLGNANQVVADDHGNRITIPTTIFNGCECQHFSCLHNEPLGVELKVANALVHRILMDTRSFTDIITWDYLKRIKHPRREITPIVHPILGFEDVPMAYNIILEWLTLHKVKAVITSYLLQLQYEIMAVSENFREINRWSENTTWLAYDAGWNHPSGKRPRVVPPTTVEDVTICTPALVGLGCPRPELVDDLEIVLLDKGRPERTVKIVWEMSDETRRALVGLHRKYKDTFTFGLEEMLGISHAVMELQKLLDAGFIR
ncbi:LOW QUALITY PROTEIN: hypothetical protein Cgig2_013742 [Carnegiea gigantea]|uniref:Uncharacterized protein n=1 Tax=Carnegiea gigantea TaxID=171969 RepID=A0A9Q1JW63_9CARY|nr:LOW QUALITY PROTEIN: hypothetical protein Cgig2_013742 [Carnegiea gigantea]